MNQQQPNRFEFVGHVGFASGPRQVDDHIAATLVVYTNEQNGMGEARSVRHAIEVWRGVAAIAITLVPGALVRVRGRIDSRSVIRDGKKVYETVLVGVWIDVLANRLGNRRQAVSSTTTEPSATEANAEMTAQ